jgi:hypothetical protein
VDSQPPIAESAKKHGIKDIEILHCFDHPIRVEDLEDGLVMLIGPDRTGRLLEVGVAVGIDGPVIVHAMEARSKYLR